MLYFFSNMLDNYLTVSTRDYNRRDTMFGLMVRVSQSDTCLSFDIKFSKVGSSRYREPMVVISDGSRPNRPLPILLPRQNEWFHTRVNLSGVDVLFFLLVRRPNFTIGLDNVSTECSSGKRKYPGRFTLPAPYQATGCRDIFKSKE